MYGINLNNERYQGANLFMFHRRAIKSGIFVSKLNVNSYGWISETKTFLSKILPFETEACDVEFHIREIIFG